MCTHKTNNGWHGKALQRGTRQKKFRPANVKRRLFAGQNIQHLSFEKNLPFKAPGNIRWRKLDLIIMKNLATNYVFYAWNYQGFFLLFFFTHLGYSLNFTVVCHCQVKGGIPPPSRGIVGDNRSTRSKTTVRRKRVGPLGSNGAPLLGSHRVIFLLVFIYRKWMLSCSMIWE